MEVNKRQQSRELCTCSRASHFPASKGSSWTTHPLRLISAQHSSDLRRSVERRGPDLRLHRPPVCCCCGSRMVNSWVTKIMRRTFLPGGSVTYIWMSARQRNRQLKAFVATGAFLWSRRPRLSPFSCASIVLSFRPVALQLKAQACRLKG